MLKYLWGSQKILQKQAKHILKNALILEKGDSPPENSLRWRKEKSLKLHGCSAKYCYFPRVFGLYTF